MISLSFQLTNPQAQADPDISGPNFPNLLGGGLSVSLN